MTYWERLSHLKLYSIERRRERFTIIYMYKIFHGLVPNPGIEFEDKGRRGIEAKLPIISRKEPTWIQNLKRNSFSFTGPTLWNTVPKEIRSHKAVSEKSLVLSFKNKLDQYLTTIPDQPTVYGLQRAAQTNSICDQQNYRINLGQEFQSLIQEFTL